MSRAIWIFSLSVLVRISKRSRANIKRLVAALASVHPRPAGLPKDLPFLWEEGTLDSTTILTVETDIGAINLLGEVAGVGSYEQAKSGAVVRGAYGRQVHIMDLRRLIASKRAAGRPKDLLLIPELEALLEATEDTAKGEENRP